MINVVTGLFNNVLEAVQCALCEDVMHFMFPKLGKMSFNC